MFRQRCNLRTSVQRFGVQHSHSWSGCLQGCFHGIDLSNMHHVEHVRWEGAAKASSEDSGGKHKEEGRNCCEGFAQTDTQTQTEFWSSMVLHFISVHSHQGYVRTQAFPGDAYGDSLWPICKAIQRHRHTWDLLPEHYMGTPHDISPGKEMQHKVGQRDTICDLLPVGHGQGAVVRAGGGEQWDGWEWEW